jgi:hypothetical protein
MTSAQLHTSTNSNSIIRGEFPTAWFFEDLLKAYPKAVLASVNELLANEQAHLAKSMSNHPDWAHLSDEAKVGLVDGHVEYSVNTPTNEVTMLEYGDPTKKLVATGLLRSTAFNRSQNLKKELTSLLSKKLSGNNA